jgi:hypothetical protein
MANGQLVKEKNSKNLIKRIHWKPGIKPLPSQYARE